MGLLFSDTKKLKRSTAQRILPCNCSRGQKPAHFTPSRPYVVISFVNSSQLYLFLFTLAGPIGPASRWMMTFHRPSIQNGSLLNPEAKTLSFTG